MALNQGNAANKNGQIGEQTIIPVLKKNGFNLFSEVDVLQNPALIKGLDRYVLTNVHYMSIYGSTKSRSEYVIFYKNRRIRVEVKYQVSTGSVDEKYPYLLLNAIQMFPEKEVILIIDGGGYKKGAREWVELQIKNNWLDFRKNGKDIKLMSIVEFINYCNKGFIS